MRHYAVPSKIAKKHRNCFVLENNSDCMAPAIPKNSFVIVDRELEPSKRGENIAAVRVKGEIFLCRTLQIQNQFVLLKENPQYRPLTLPSEFVVVLGTVVWASGKKRSDAALAEVVQP